MWSQFMYLVTFCGLGLKNKAFFIIKKEKEKEKVKTRVRYIKRKLALFFAHDLHDIIIFSTILKKKKKKNLYKVATYVNHLINLCIVKLN